MMGFAGIDTGPYVHQNSLQSVRMSETQEITAPSCPYPAIMSRLSISGRVVAGWRAANPSKPQRQESPGTAAKAIPASTG
jgi:hypothetical protein